VHRRETSNALNASICCEQKRLQKLPETVLADTKRCVVSLRQLSFS